MFRKILKFKIHRTTVTEATLENEGSTPIDGGLLESAGTLHLSAFASPTGATESALRLM